MAYETIIEDGIDILVVGAGLGGTGAAWEARFWEAGQEDQDLWLTDNEAGWGVNVTHQDNTLFATLFTYVSSGRDMWLSMSSGTRQPGLRGLRAARTLKVGALKANNVRASHVRMDLKAQGGRVDVSPLNADFYQGKLASAITINAAPAVPSFAVRHKMTGVNVGPLLKDLANNDMLEGKGDVTADVNTHGNTVSALKRALAGNAAVHLADGAVKGIDIAGSIRNARAKLGSLRGEQTQAADKSQKTDFSELTATR